MKKLKLVVGVHGHLPIGQEEALSENNYQSALKPFLAGLYCHPSFPATLHVSGTLLEWMEEYHPEFIMLLEEMVKRGQIELLGGGYFDPMLPMIPANDRLGQLEKMTTYLRGRFGVRVRGCWIAENVWEPSLASVLRASGIDYTFLEDSQLASAGVEGGLLLRPSLTEDQGKIISVFPIATDISARFAASDPNELIACLKGVHEARTPGVHEAHTGEGAGSCTVIVMNDSSRFDLADSRLEGKWLESFIQLASESEEWLLPVSPSQCLKDDPPVSRIYVPSSASARVSEWALSPERRRLYRQARGARGSRVDGSQLIAGGYYRQFLTRYPESGLMYAKMMYTHLLVSQVHGDRYKKKAAQNELWKGQCHYAYWHGGEGGIYQNALRKAVYSSLIEAEKITRATEIFAPSIISVDYDMDNGLEYLYQGSELNAYIQTRGGALFELDFLPASWNYLDTLAEACEDTGAPWAVTEAGEGPPRYTRRAFLDHFFAPGCTLEDFRSGRFSESGDFIDGAYEMVELNRSLPEVLLKRSGFVASPDGKVPLEIEKRFIFRPRSIDVYYKLRNRGGSDLKVRFGVETNVSLASRTVEAGRIFLLNEDRTTEIGLDPMHIEGAQGLLVRDVRNEVSITLSSARQFACWNLPVETHACSREAKPVFQSYCFVPQWSFDLSAGAEWENHLSVGFEKTRAAG